MLLVPLVHPLASRPVAAPPANRFSIAVSPTTRSLVQGGTATYGITLTLTAGAAETATLSTQGLPTGVTASWDDNTISTDGGTATLTLTAAADAPAVNLDAFTIRATAASQTKSKGATVTVQANDFSVAVTNDGDSIAQGANAAFTITLTKTSGNAQTTSAIVVSGLPSGVTAVVADETISTDGGTTTCTLSASGSATIGAGSFTVSVTAPSGTRADTGTVTITESGGAVPVNVIAPEITGTLAVDDIAEVLNTGGWDNTPTSYTYQWTRDGEDIVGETASTYTVVLADVGLPLICLVTAHNAAGASAPAPSNGVTVDAGGVTLSRSAAGEIASYDFSTLSGWTNGGGWSSVQAPRLVAKAAFPRPLFVRGLTDDADGVREGQLYIEGSTWWLLYDAGNGTDGWRQFIASSADRGLTWTRHGETSEGLAKITSGDWVAVATGWLEKRGSTYYRHRVLAPNDFGDPNFGLPGGPYGWDIWSASSITGTWAGVTEQATEVGTFGEDEKLPGSNYFDGTTYHNFCQGNDGSYKIGRATSSTPGGTYTISGGAIATSSTPAFGGRQPENPRVFRYTGFTDPLYVLLCNLIATAGTYTDGNAALTSASLTDWSSMTADMIQVTGKSAAENAVGVISHVTGPDGALVWDSATGHVPTIFDGATGGQSSPGWHRYRKLRSLDLLPSEYCARFSDASSTSKALTRAVTHSDFVAEFVVRFNNETIDTNVGLWFRQDPGLDDGYRLVVRNQQWLLLQKVVGGSVSTVQAASTGTVAGARMNHIRIVASGSQILAYIDGELQINATDATFASGTHLGIAGYDANADVRLLSIYEADTATVTGLTAHAKVVLRSPGGLPVSTAIADATGAATLIAPSWPQGAVEVNGTDYTPGALIYGGDVLAFTGGTPGTAAYSPESDTNAVLWLDATRETGAPSSALATLTDYSATGADFTQATSGNRPLLEDTANGVRPGYSFTLANEKFVTCTGFAALNGASGAALFMLVKMPALLGGLAGDATNQVFFTTGGDKLQVQVYFGTLYVYASSGNSGNCVIPEGLASDYLLLGLIFDGAQTGNARLKLYINGTEQTLTYGGTMPATLPSGDDSEIGRQLATDGGYADMSLLELLVVDSAPDATQRQAIEAYFAAKHSRVF